MIQSNTIRPTAHFRITAIGSNATTRNAIVNILTTARYGEDLLITKPENNIFDVTGLNEDGVAALLELGSENVEVRKLVSRQEHWEILGG